MKVLILGQGAREHGLVRAVRHSASTTQVFAIPGSNGISSEALCQSLDAGDPKVLLNFVRQFDIELVVIGPEALLVTEIADQLRENGIPVLAPSRAASQLEGSKVFAKKFMVEHEIPTARFAIVKSVQEVINAISEFKPPYVLKADGLAAGKGVFVCADKEELILAARALFEERIFGAAGAQALLEEHLAGWELSLLVLTNGHDYQLLPLTQDHKRLEDDDGGPNTGGMGVVGPIVLEESLLQKIEAQILRPTINGIAKSGWPYRGILYVGLMMTERGPFVLEYNVRFGDPECQTIMPLLDGDWVEVLHRVAEGEVPKLRWKPIYTSCVVLAAPGYPEKPQSGVSISGDLQFETPSSYFLHAGTKKISDSEWVTAGGRVLNAIGIGNTLKEAINNSYAQAERVSWKGLQMRRDIGKKILKVPGSETR